MSLSGEGCYLPHRWCLPLGLPTVENPLEPLYKGLIPSTNAPYQDHLPSHKGPASSFHTFGSLSELGKEINTQAPLQ